jgi:hypothetical protein
MHSIRFVRSLLLALVLCALVMLAMPAPSFAQLSISITFAPPALPVYEQPVIPDNGYLWTPGYWQWSPNDGDYYWVPGTWVQPPEAELLWTPGYWSWGGGAFIWNDGYWGPQVGFYGGVNYGYGYTGGGYEGGYWKNRAFFYNRSVNNVTNVTTITNVYNKTVVNNVTINNVSYNGGNGGITAQPTPAQRTAASARHIPPTATQTQHQHAASTNRALLASVNHGKPPIAATSKPGVFSGGGVVAAKAAAPYHPPTRVAANLTTPRSPNPASGGTHPVITAHPAPSPSATKPARTTERAAPAEGRNQPAQPKSKSAQPTSAPAEQRAAAPAERRSEPPKVASNPPVAQQRNAPPPKSAPHPSGEKPKEEHKSER